MLCWNRTIHQLRLCEGFRDRSCKQTHPLFSCFVLLRRLDITEMVVEQVVVVLTVAAAAIAAAAIAEAVVATAVVVFNSLPVQRVGRYFAHDWYAGLLKHRPDLAAAIDQYHHEDSNREWASEFEL